MSYIPKKLGDIISTSEEVKTAAVNYTKVAAIVGGAVLLTYVVVKTRQGYLVAKKKVGEKVKELSRYRVRLVKE